MLTIKELRDKDLVHIGNLPRYNTVRDLSNSFAELNRTGDIGQYIDSMYWFMDRIEGPKLPVAIAVISSDSIKGVALLPEGKRDMELGLGEEYKKILLAYGDLGDFLQYFHQHPFMQNQVPFALSLGGIDFDRQLLIYGDESLIKHPLKTSSGYSQPGGMFWDQI